jgi:hypothetical protein
LFKECWILWMWKVFFWFVSVSLTIILAKELQNFAYFDCSFLFLLWASPTPHRSSWKISLKMSFTLPGATFRANWIFFL